MPNSEGLESIGGKNLDDLSLSPEIEQDAAQRVDNLKKSSEEVAELAFLTRAEILSMLRAEIGEAKEGELKSGRKEQYAKAFENLMQKKSFQLKVAYCKKLLQRANDTLQKGLKKHVKEQRELNGNYLDYRKLWNQQLKLEKQLEEVMAELFAERGHDPDSMLVETRQILEDGLKEICEKMLELKKRNPDTAAFLQYEKIKKYSQELERGFAWTESRKELVDEALKRAMASRPMIVLMGESGVGKTALAKALSRKLTGMDPEREVGGKDYRLRDLLGGRAIDAQGDYLKFGPLMRAMTGMETSRDKAPKNEGGVYFDDEFNTRPVEVQRQILKFVAEAKPGQKVTVPGTELKVTVQPKFLYLAAGNPNNARYDREETPVEAYREFSGVLDVDYLKQNKDAPELMEVMVASLMDQKTRRLRVVSKEEVMPNFNEENGKSVLDETSISGGFIWRFAQAWKGLLQAFAQKENSLHLLNPAQSKEKYYLQKFVLDPGKVRDWLHQYKLSANDQKNGIEIFLRKKMIELLASYPAEDQVLVREMMKHFGIDLNDTELKKVFEDLGLVYGDVLPGSKEFTIMTPKEIGYLFPNVERPRKSGAGDGRIPPEVPPAPVADIDDEGNDIAPVGRKFRNVGQFFRAIESGLVMGEMNKIKDMVNQYTESVAAAQEIDPSVVIKPIEEVLTEVLKLGAPMLKEIAKFEKPTLLVVPRNDFMQKKAAMDANRKYLNQDVVYVNDEASGPFKNVSTPAKVSVSIVDGGAHMPHIQGIKPDSRFDQRKLDFKHYYKQKGMKLINVHEYSVLMQKSLRNYEISGANDTSRIVDFYKDGNDTVTCLDDENLTNSASVACGYFNSGYRAVDFFASDPADADRDLRGRPSVQVMSY